MGQINSHRKRKVFSSKLLCSRMRRVNGSLFETGSRGVCGVKSVPFLVFRLDEGKIIVDVQT